MMQASTLSQKWTKPHKNGTFTGSSAQNPPQKKLQIVIFGNRILTQKTKLKSCKFILAVKMSPRLGSSFIFFSLYDVTVLAAIMILYLILVFFILDQVYFENNT